MNYKNRLQIKTFERNLKKILVVSSPKNNSNENLDRLYDKNDEMPVTSKSSHVFVPFVSERNGIGKLLPTTEKGNSIYITERQPIVSTHSVSDENKLNKKFVTTNRFKQTLTELMAYNEEKQFKKQKNSQLQRNSPCFLSPSRDHFFKFQEKNIPALGIFYLPPLNTSEEKKHKNSINQNSEITNFSPKNINYRKESELTDPDIVNSFNNRKILCLPDFNRQLGRNKEEFQVKRKKNKDFAKEDEKTIDKKIEFHKYLAKKYNRKMKIGPFLQINTDNLPFSYDQLMTKRFKILDNYHIKYNKGRMKYAT